MIKKIICILLAVQISILCTGCGSRKVNKICNELARAESITKDIADDVYDVASIYASGQDPVGQGGAEYFKNKLDITTDELAFGLSFAAAELAGLNGEYINEKDLEHFRDNADDILARNNNAKFCTMVIYGVNVRNGNVAKILKHLDRVESPLYNLVDENPNGEEIKYMVTYRNSIRDILEFCRSPLESADNIKDYIFGTMTKIEVAKLKLSDPSK